MPRAPPVMKAVLPARSLGGLLASARADWAWPMAAAAAAAAPKVPMRMALRRLMAVLSGVWVIGRSLWFVCMVSGRGSVGVQRVQRGQPLGRQLAVLLGLRRHGHDAERGQERDRDGEEKACHGMVLCRAAGPGPRV